MIYEYKCSCGEAFDVYKPVAEFDSPEMCKACGQVAERQITGGAGFMGAKVEYAEYNPGLGCVTKSAEHRRLVAKAKGLEEIGNETPSNIQSSYDALRAEKHKRSWDEV